MHYMGLHALRREYRDPRKWNWANDAVINETLIKANIGEFIDGGVRQDGADALSSEKVYAEMPDQAPDFTLDGDLMEGSGENGDGKSGGMSQAEKSALEAEVKMTIVQAAKSAKMRGSALPPSIQRIVDEILEVKTPWFDILERHMHAYKLDDTSWSRPNRRFVHADIYMPGKNYIPQMGEVVIAYDTSGSIGDEEIKHFNGHVSRILQDCRPSKVYFVACDACVRNTDETEALEDITFVPQGGGGTAFQPVFDWVDEQNIRPDVLVYLTDLCGDTDFEPPPYHTIWLTTESEGASFGEVVKYEIV
jgi:predicted metal-dependent peptidase